MLSSQYEQLKSRSISIKSDITSSKRKLKDSKDKLGEAESKIDGLREKYRVQEKSVEVLKEVIEGMSKDHIKQVEDLVTFGLHTIFYDREYALKIEVTDKRNTKSAEIFLLEQKEDSIIKSAEDEIGGGVRVVIGFILQVFYIQYFEQNDIIFADEAFSQLSDRYIEGLMEFINRLAEKRDFKVVLISHDERLTSQADKVYMVNEGEIELVTEKEG